MPVVDTEIAARGLWVVISLVFASGLGLPVPSAPVLLGAGVLAGSGRFSLAGVIAGAFLAHLATDFVWYGLGRWRGQRILGRPGDAAVGGNARRGWLSVQRARRAGRGSCRNPGALAGPRGAARVRG